MAKKFVKVRVFLYFLIVIGLIAAMIYGAVDMVMPKKGICNFGADEYKCDKYNCTLIQKGTGFKIDEPCKGSFAMTITCAILLIIIVVSGVSFSNSLLGL
jgi:hypothetical protein